MPPSSMSRKTRLLFRKEPGFKSVVWDGRNDLGETMGAGVYLYQIKTDHFIETQKMVLLR